MPQYAKPAGHVPLPLILFGFVSLFLGVLTELMGIFDGMTDALRELWKSGGLTISAEMGLPGVVGILITAAACFGLSAAILGTPGGGRRAMIGFTGLFLTLTLIPAFAVWGIFWKPFGVLLSVAWSWFSATIYAQMHRMPCEGIAEVPAVNVINLKGEIVQEAQYHPQKSDGQS